jgi:hypothetical protein
MMHWRRLLPYAAFVVVPSALILPILFSGKMLHGMDVAGAFHYTRSLLSESLRSGRLPLWDPHAMLGFPMLAEVQSAVFYPPSWLCLVLSPGAFWTVSVLGHMILAGLFARAWLRQGLELSEGAAQTGGFLYMCSAFLMTRVYAGHVNYIWAYPWVVAVLWRLELFLRQPALRPGALLALVWAMLLLAGMPQFPCFAAMAAGIRLVHRALSGGEGRAVRARTGSLALVWFFVGTCWSAPQILPSVELVSQMQRSAGDESLLYYSLPPENWVLWFLPTYWGDDVTRPFLARSFIWESCGYIGIFGILLSLAALAGRSPQRFLWASVAAVAVLLALGKYAPFYWIFTSLVPGSSAFRPARFLLLSTTAGCALAAMGYEHLRDRLPPRYRAAAAAVGAAMAVELLWFGARFFVAQDPAALSWPKSFTADLRSRVGTEGRVASAGRVSPDWVGRCQEAGIDHVGGYEPMMLKRYAEFVNTANGGRADQHSSLQVRMTPSPMARMLCAKVWLMGPRGTPPDSWRQVGAFDENKVYEDPAAMPRAWVVPGARIVASRDERLRLLASAGFNPSETVILETEPREPSVGSSATPGRATVVFRDAGEYRVEVDGGGGWLVLSEAYYPGWTAEIDGRAVDVMPGNHLLQAVPVPEGRHGVRFVYRSRFLGAGIGIALLAGGALLALWLLGRRRAEHSSSILGTPPL